MTLSTQQRHRGWLSVVRLWFLCCYVPVAHAYSTGAPLEACSSMEPTGHGIGPQTTEPPVHLAIDYLSASQVAVTVSSSSRFKGVLLQAHSEGEFRSVGRWIINDTTLQTLSCFTDDDSVTHTNNNDKNQVSAEWLPENVPNGSVYFIATVVKVKTQYWMNVTTNNIPIVNGEIQITPNMTDLKPTDDLVSSDNILTLIIIGVGYVGMYTIFSLLLV